MTQSASKTPTDLAAWCDHYLDSDAFKDYCPNGLQVDAGVPIKKLITGVSATQYLIEQAIEHQADAILVHHGYFWKGEQQTITGMKGNRIRTLLQNSISMLAYHLPLDAHPCVGNNAVLATQLGLKITGALCPQQPHPIGNIAQCTPQPVADLIKIITDKLNRPPLHIPADRHASTPTDRIVSKIGICTGGAQDMIEQSADMACDVYISGEISERTTHFARELGIDYLACGHHATEMGGVQALGALIAQEHNIDVVYIDDPNPA